MVCSKCGKDAGESKFCPECGAQVIENAVLPGGNQQAEVSVMTIA